MSTTDIDKIINDLLDFYDLTGQSIISVGAGGGQLVEYGRKAAKVIAVDNDESALEKLRENLLLMGLTDKFTTVHSDFIEFSEKADVVVFEFCLHEMADPARAIKHALELAPRTVVMDHWVSSEWAYVIDEKEKIANSWNVIESFGFRKCQQYDSLQVFRDYDELYQKIKGQGETAVYRIAKYKDAQNFSIPFIYAFALI